MRCCDDLYRTIRCANVVFLFVLCNAVDVGVIVNNDKIRESSIFAIQFAMILIIIISIISIS